MEVFKVKMFVCKNDTFFGAFSGAFFGAFFTRLSGGSVFFRRIERRFKLNPLSPEPLPSSNALCQWGNPDFQYFMFLINAFENDSFCPKTGCVKIDFGSKLASKLSKMVIFMKKCHCVKICFASHLVA